MVFGSFLPHKDKKSSYYFCPAFCKTRHIMLMVHVQLLLTRLLVRWFPVFLQHCRTVLIEYENCTDIQ